MKANRHVKRFVARQEREAKINRWKKGLHNRKGPLVSSAQMTIDYNKVNTTPKYGHYLLLDPLYERGGMVRIPSGGALFEHLYEDALESVFVKSKGALKSYVDKVYGSGKDYSLKQKKGIFYGTVLKPLGNWVSGMDKHYLSLIGNILDIEHEDVLDGESIEFVLDDYDVTDYLKLQYEAIYAEYLDKSVMARYGGRKGYIDNLARSMVSPTVGDIVFALTYGKESNFKDPSNKHKISVVDSGDRMDALIDGKVALSKIKKDSEGHGSYVFVVPKSAYRQLWAVEEHIEYLGYGKIKRLNY
jgi:hypothetical protein